MGEEVEERRRSIISCRNCWQETLAVVTSALLQLQVPAEISPIIMQVPLLPLHHHRRPEGNQTHRHRLLPHLPSSVL